MVYAEREHSDQIARMHQGNVKSALFTNCYEVPFTGRQSFQYLCLNLCITTLLCYSYAKK